MSIIWADTFNKYGTSLPLLLNGLYAEVGNSVALARDPDPSSTTNVLATYSNPVGGIRLRRVFNSPKSGVGVALRLWLGQLPPNNSCIPSFVLVTGTGAGCLSITVDTIGRIVVKAGYGSAAVMGTTAAPVVTANGWYHIEFKATASILSGTYEVRVNGTPVLTGSGNTGPEYSQFILENPYSNSQTNPWFVKDLIAWDTTGSFNNDFLGTCSVLDLLPNADVSLTWTPSTGTTGYNRINIIPPTDDASYISAASVLANTFDFANLPASVTSVRAMIVDTRPRKTDGGDGNVQAGLKSGASLALGLDRPITTAYTYYEDVFETDPVTGLAWTPTAANAAQLYLKRTV